jgi:hypothetical protein
MPASTTFDYACAVQVPGLRADQQSRLIEHIARSNEAQPDQDPVAWSTARCAATLLAADPRRPSVPLALAQAMTVMQHPSLGPALMNLHEGLQALTRMKPEELTGLKLHAQATGVILQALQSEISQLLAAIASRERSRERC